MVDPEDRLDAPWLGTTLDLRRRPDHGPTALRAWSHGEERLLQPVDDRAAPARLLLWSDEFGALALGTAGLPRLWVCDSARSLAGARSNLARNPAVRLADGDAPAVGPATAPTPYRLDQPEATVAPSQPITNRCWATTPPRLGDALAAWGPPPTEAWLVWPRAHDAGFAALARLGATLEAGTPVRIGARAEDLSARTLQRLQAALDDAQVGRVCRRGRIVSGRLRPHAAPTATAVGLAGGWHLFSHPGVFAHGHLDVGTARLLPLVPARPQARRIVDLGCGNGVLGLQAAALHPGAEVLFCDDASLALDAAARGVEANRGRLATCQPWGLHADTLDAVATASVDLVLCNPPFHVGRDTTRQAAAAMFCDAARVLRDDGALLVVANRHLGYAERLGELFGQVAALAADPRFVVLRARRPRAGGRSAPG